METQSLVDLADIYNDCKNYGKAGQLMLSSLPKWYSVYCSVYLLYSYKSTNTDA
jgi:hypothetical protein